MAKIISDDPHQSELVQSAAKFSKEIHEKIQQEYGDKPYFDTHVVPVVNIGRKFIYLITEKNRQFVLAALYLHDLLEDAGAHVNYNTIKKLFGSEVAEIVFAMTNSKGRTPDEREDDNYYQGLRDIKLATYGKLCDRIANSHHGRADKSKQWLRYQSKCDEFCEKLYFPRYTEMFAELREELDMSMAWRKY